MSKIVAKRNKFYNDYNLNSFYIIWEILNTKKKQPEVRLLSKFVSPMN